MRRLYGGRLEVGADNGNGRYEGGGPTEHAERTVLRTVIMIGVEDNPVTGAE